MAYNGSGLFVIDSTGQPVVANTLIEASTFNALTADVATGLSTAICKDGQTTITANLPMSGFKFTGLGAGSANGHSLRYEQLFSTSAVTLLGAMNWVKGADIASASTVNLTTATGNGVHITGTTTITAVTLGSGMWRIVIFDGILTLTHHATDNNLPGGVNITTAAGDRALYWSDGTTVYCAAYMPAAGYQEKDALLTSLAGQTVAANKIQAYSAADTASLLDFKDEDDMASNSATAVPSQQSVKAYVDANASSITLGTEQASTSGTAITFTSIPSGTKRITVMFVRVSTNGTGNLLIQIGDSGGIETTGYESNAVTFTNNSVIDSTAGIVCTAVMAATSVHSGAITFSLEDAANNTWVATGMLIDSNGVYTHFCAGDKSLSAVLDRISVTTVGGTDTFDSGAINISYE